MAYREVLSNQTFSYFKQAIGIVQKQYPQINITKSTNKDTTYWFRYNNSNYSINYSGANKISVSKIGVPGSTKRIIVNNNRFDLEIIFFIKQVINNKF